MANRVHLSDLKDQSESDLRMLLEKFIKKSEELEKRESKVLKQVELVQSAVASLQAWQQSANPATSATSLDALHLDMKKIEEETQEIRQETERIQREVRQKIEDNKKLQDEIDRRKAQQTGREDEFVTDSFFRRMDEEARFKRLERKEIESRAVRDSGHSHFTHDPGINFFNEKLEKLKLLEKKVKRELEQEAEEARKKRTMAGTDLPGRESHRHVPHVSSVRKKAEKQETRS